MISTYNNSGYFYRENNHCLKTKISFNNEKAPLNNTGQQFKFNQFCYQTNFSNQSFKAKVDLTKEKEIERIRTGTLGKIRSSEELATDDVIKLIDQQLMTTTSEDISKIIDSYPSEDREIALKILQRMTQFANMDSLNHLADIISENNGSLYYNKQDQHNLNAIFLYLSAKDAFDIKMRNNRGSLLLDNITIEKLENNAEYLEYITNNPNIKLIYPEGWMDGINVFSQTKDIKTQLNQLLKTYKQYKRRNSLFEDEVLNLVFTEAIQSKMNKLNLSSKLTIVSRLDKNNKLNPTPKSIASQLKPDSITNQDLEKVLMQFPQEYKQHVLEILCHETNIFSPKRLSFTLKDLHKKIIASNNYSDKGIYYFIPEEYRSYGMVTMLYQIANNIPNNHILASRQDIPSDARKIVILDDVIASGNQILSGLHSLASNIIPSDNINEVILASLLINKGSIDKVKKRSEEIMGLPTSLIFTETNECITKGEYFNSLAKEDKKIYEKIFQSSNENFQLCTAFPYMAPDNNIQLFSSLIAPFFTLNKSGVKNIAREYKFPT